MQENYVPSAENPLITKDALGALVVLVKTELSTISNSAASKEDVQQAIQNLTNVLQLQSGTVLKENLATLADTAKVGQVFLVSDDNNHFYIFLGKEAAGADENGFYDLGDHFDASNLASKEELTALSNMVTALEPRVAANETGVAKIDPLATRVTGIEDALETLATKAELANYVPTTTLETLATKTELASYATTETVTGLETRLAAIETEITGVATSLASLIGG